jgi:transposase
VYCQKEPATLVRFVGHAPLEATVFEMERLRCNACGEVFTADEPQTAGPAKYDETAVSMIALLKYGTGVPFKRLERLQEHLGMPLPATTQRDLMAAAAKRMRPVLEELIRQAAQGSVMHNDDTGMRILRLTREPGDKRTGTFTSGIVSMVGAWTIALFFTGWKHAGENIAEVLKQRARELPAPIQMCDALSRNRPKLEGVEPLMANCLAHGRRQVVEVAENFPEECRYVLETLRDVYHHDALARQQELSPEQRLRFHQEHSGPLMKGLHEWMETQLSEHKTEPNSGLGKAISYLLNHWLKLTLFLRQPGAPIDNNIVERALKKAILNRNYVHQVSTWRCAAKSKFKGTESGFPGKGTVHNHSVSRKARRRSLGSKRLRLLPGIVILSIALFFIARSASTYMWVVAVLSCPSQSAITVISTPD